MMKGNMVLFGVGSMLSDIIDCAREAGKRIDRIVLNTEERTRERTKGFEARLSQSEAYSCGRSEPAEWEP